MRGHRTSWRIAIALLIAAGLAPASHAQYLKCDSQRITAPDARNVLIAAQRAAGNLPIIKSTLHVCMNPGFGRAWLDAKSEPQTDGTELTHSLWCDRDRGPWKCEVSTTRHATVDFKRPGNPKHVDFDLPLDMDVAKARWLITRIFEDGPGMQRIHECGAKPDIAGENYSTQAVQDIHNAFAHADERETASVSAGDAWVSVTFAGNIFLFRQSSNAGGWEFDCWSFEVVVT